MFEAKDIPIRKMDVQLNFHPRDRRYTQDHLCEVTKHSEDGRCYQLTLKNLADNRKRLNVLMDKLRRANIEFSYYEYPSPLDNTLILAKIVEVGRE